MTISGWNAKKMLKPSANVLWFKGWKDTHKDNNVSGTMTLEALHCFLLPATPTDKPLAFASPDVYRIAGWIYSLWAKWRFGVLKSSMVITFALVNVTTEVQYVEMLCEAFPVDSVGFNIKNVSVKDFHCGDVAGDSKNDIPMKTTFSTAQFAELNEKTDCYSFEKLEDDLKFLKSGDTPIIHVVPVNPMCVKSFFTVFL
ncbi:hypothetical protein P7K49_006234 [Saguinus oedipus]|uniref:Uncharacterized protein n=1 Tax=Saguinus oedipus TaxID=9490 RepID=A0ABQ9W1U3_SAGOE|nr:hypothetical protein P7K49_006234 [Saguinus oedipus]